MESIHNHNKTFIGRLRLALYDISPSVLKSQLAELFAPNCDIKLAFPFENLDGPTALYEQAYAPLIEAVPDLERRDFIVMAGESNGQNWVGCGGHYMGVFERPWLDIPHTNHLIAMRALRLCFFAWGGFVARKVSWMNWVIPSLVHARLRGAFAPLRGAVSRCCGRVS